jgi:hypothetical protein
MPSIDWDGENDLIIATPWILEDVGLHSSFDEVAKKVMAENKIPGLIMSLAFMLSNRYTSKLRKKA